MTLSFQRGALVVPMALLLFLPRVCLAAVQDDELESWDEDEEKPVVVVSANPDDPEATIQNVDEEQTVKLQAKKRDALILAGGILGLAVGLPLVASGAIAGAACHNPHPYIKGGDCKARLAAPILFWTGMTLVLTGLVVVVVGLISGIEPPPDADSNTVLVSAPDDGPELAISDGALVLHF